MLWRLRSSSDSLCASNEHVWIDGKGRWQCNLLPGFVVSCMLSFMISDWLDTVIAIVCECLDCLKDFMIKNKGFAGVCKKSFTVRNICLRLLMRPKAHKGKFSRFSCTEIRRSINFSRVQLEFSFNRR